MALKQIFAPVALFALVACTGIPSGDATIGETAHTIGCGSGTHLVGDTCVADTTDGGVGGAGGGTATTTSHKGGAGGSAATTTSTATKSTTSTDTTSDEPTGGCVKPNADGTIKVTFTVDRGANPGNWNLKGNLVEDSGAWDSIASSDANPFGFETKVKGLGAFNGTNGSHYLVENNGGDITAIGDVSVDFGCGSVSAKKLQKGDAIEAWGVGFAYAEYGGKCSGPNVFVNASDKARSVAYCP